jgi:tetratricopeptide (TPR) repeat protein
MSKATSTRSRRLNLRAVAVVGIILVAALPGAIGLKVLQERRARPAYLNEAKGLLAKKQYPLALSYLNRYLLLNPRDVEALELKADLLADASLHAARVNRAQAQNQLAEASQALSHLLGIDPDGPKRLETRIKLLRINLETDLRAQVAVEQAEKILLQVLNLTAEPGKERAVIQVKVRELAAGAAADRAQLDRVAELLRLSARGYEYWSTYGAGEDSATQERLVRAREDYETAEKLVPGDVAGAELLASLFVNRLKDPARAREVLDRLIETTAKDPGKHAQALLARHRYFYELSQQAELPHEKVVEALKDARADVEEAAKADPTGFDVLMAAATFSLMQRETKAARRYLAAIPDDRRDEYQVKVVEGMIDLAEQRRDEAIQTWRAGLIKAGGTDADLTWKLASVLLEADRREEAMPLIEQFGRLVGGKQPSPRYLFLQGFALLKGDRPGEAIKVFEPLRYSINKPDPGDAAGQKYHLEPSLYYLLGQAYEKGRDPAKALEAYHQSAEMSPDWSPPWQAAARLLKDSRPDEAAAFLRRGLALNPSDPKLLADLAQLLYREQMAKPPAQRSWSEIERMIKTAKASSPGSPEVALVEADYLAATGRWEEAIGLLETACRLRPQATELWLARVNAAIRRNQYGQALSVLDEAIARAGPRSEFYMNRATVLAIKGNVSGSRDALTEGLARVPVDQRPALLKALGDLHKARRDYPAARVAYQEWARLRPDEPAPRVGLVDVAIASGDELEITRAIEGVRGIGGEKGYYWQFARVEDLLRDRPKEKPDPARDAERFKQARALIEEVKADAPKLALGPYLEGRLCEREGKVDDAAAAYTAAVNLNGGVTALNPLVTLLVREKRDGALDQLRESHSELAGEIDKIAAMAALRTGNKGRAEQLAAMAVEGNPQGLDLRLWQAEVLRDVGKPKEAEDALNRLTARKPTDAAPWLQLLMLQVSQHRTKDAAETVEKIRKNVQTAYPPVLLGQCYRTIGNIPRALDCYREALSRWPNDPTVLASAVLFFQQVGRRDDAEQTLRSILRRDASNAWASRGLALSLAGHPNDRASWEEALKLVGPDPGPNDVPEDLVARARVYAAGPTAADRRKAIGILEKLLSELPEMAAVQDLVARLYLADGQFQKALEHAAKAAKDDPAPPDAILLYASILLQAKDYDGADAQLDRLTRIDPNSLPVAEQRARVLVARGRPGDAAAVMEKAFDSYPSGPESTVVGKELARLLRGWGQNEAAERVARKIAGQSTLGRCFLAEQLASQGKNDEAAAQLEEAARAGDPDNAGGSALSLAVTPGTDPRWLSLADRYLTEAVKHSPSSPALQEKLALVKHLQGKFAEEVAVYRTLLALNPGNYEFLNNMAWTISQEMKQPREGLKWADEAVKKAGPKAAILDTRGVILTRLAQFDRAIRDLEDASRENAAGPFLFHLALAYKKAGRVEDWRKCRDRVLKAGLTRDQLQPSELADWDEIMGMGR